MVKTAKTGAPVIIKFLLLMSGANLIWGVLTGSWFGFDISRAPQVLQNITLPLITNISYVPGWLETYNANNFWITSGIVAPYATIEALDAAVLTNFKLFCFLIALVHLCLGHILRLVSFIKSPKALGEIGHLAMIFAMFFVVTSMIVYNAGFGLVMPWHLYLLAGGFMLVFLFSNYETGMGQSVSASMTDIISLLLTITGAFADITSYIRLWAVALAGAAIAHTVNGLAEPLLASFILFIFGAVFFFCGHIFNIVLNAMAFLIHGIRLNTLEFSSHLGLEWAGIPYKPFSKRS
jgi:V/A-type H+-transporting ATPase subunit I